MTVTTSPTLPLSLPLSLPRRRRRSGLNLDKRGDTIRAVLLNIARNRSSHRKGMPTFAELVRLLGVPNRRCVVYHTRVLARSGFISRVDHGTDPMVLKMGRGR